jgi:hypothetical protein
LPVRKLFLSRNTITVKTKNYHFETALTFAFIRRVDQDLVNRTMVLPRLFCHWQIASILTMA